MVKLIKKIYNGILENFTYSKYVHFVKAGSREQLVENVNELIDEGWELNGKWSVDGYSENNTLLWRQPMFRKILK